MRMKMNSASFSSYNISRSRMILASFLILSLVGIHLYEIIASTEHWPFSSYPMYSMLHESDSFTTLKIVGIRATDNKPIPMNAAWLRKTFTRLSRREDAPAQLRRALKKFFEAYQAEKRRGAHQAAIKGVRVYQETSRLSDSGESEILESKLLAEYSKSKKAPRRASTTHAAH